MKTVYTVAITIGAVAGVGIIGYGIYKMATTPKMEDNIPPQPDRVPLDEGRPVVNNVRNLRVSDNLVVNPRVMPGQPLTPQTTSAQTDGPNPNRNINPQNIR